MDMHQENIDQAFFALLSEQDIQQKATLVHLLRAHVAFQRFERKYGINIPAASDANLKNLIAELGELSQAERFVCTLIEDYLVFSHGTSALEAIKKEGRLQSLKVRQYASSTTGNRNTSTHTETDGNVFMTVELGDTPAPPSFLGDEIDYIRVQAKQFKQHHPLSALNYAWVSSHLGEFGHRSEHSRTFGNTHYHFIYCSEPLQKITTYTYDDGAKTEYISKFADEIFYGDQLIPGVALTIIRHLRRLNNAYAQQLLDDLSDPNTPEPQRVQRLFSVMKALSPTEMYPECKVPGEFSIQSNAVTLLEKKLDVASEKFTLGLDSMIKLFSPHNPANRAIERVKDLLYYANVEHMKQFPNHADYLQQLEQDSSSIGRVIRSSTDRRTPQQKCALIEYLLELGATLREDSKEDHVIDAIKSNSPLLLDFLLQQAIRCPDDPSIVRTLQVNRRKISIYFDPISHVCESGQLDMLMVLHRHGANLSRYATFWLMLAASKGHVAIVNYFIDAGFDHLLQADFDSYTHPMLAFAKADCLEGVEYLLSRSTMALKYPHNHDEAYCFTPLHFAALNSNEKMAQCLLEDGRIEVDAQAADGRTAMAIAQQQQDTNMIALLKAYGADPNIDLNALKRRVSTQEHAVAIVTGFDDAGEPVVILGRKWSESSGMEKTLLCPGGIKNYRSDPSLLHTAAREFDEETNFRLTQLWQEQQIQPQEIYRYITEIDGLHYTIAFIHFDLGIKLMPALKQYPLRAQDDLAKVAVCKLLNIQVDASKETVDTQFCYVEGDQSQPVMPSNAILLHWLAQKRSTPELSLSQKQVKYLHYLCSIANFAKQQLKSAIMTNDGEALATLCAHDVKPIFTYYSGQGIGLLTPLALACQDSTPDIVEQLLPYYKDLPDEIANAVYRCLKNPEHGQAIFDLLKEQSYITKACAISCLITAIDQAQLDYVEQLIMIHPDIVNTTLPGHLPPLALAAKKGHLAIVQVLFENGARDNPDDYGKVSFTTTIEPAFILAIEFDHQPVFDYLLNAGADVNTRITIDKTHQFATYLGLHAGMFMPSLEKRTQWQLLEDKRRCVGDRCALLSAIKFNREQMAQTLLEHPNLDRALAAELMYKWRYNHGAQDLSYYQDRSETLKSIASTLIEEHRLTLAEESSEEENTEDHPPMTLERIRERIL